MADDLTQPFIGYRSAGRRPESRQDRAAAQEAPLAALRGFASGVLGAPGDIEALVRMLPGLNEQTVLPTSEDVERRLPGRDISQRSPTGRAFTGAGQLAGGFYAGPGSPLRAIAALPGAVRKAGRDFVMAAGQPAVNVVKPKGGNWRADSAENAMDFMKFSVLNEQGLANLAERQGPQLVAEYMAENAPKLAINQWLDKKLANYVRNELGTPEDPIRALAERGVVPYELPPLNTYNQNALVDARTDAGFPKQGLATTRAGREWEAAADQALSITPASEIAADWSTGPRNPWAANLPPDTPVYGVGMSAPGRLGFGHVVDQLMDAMGASDLETVLPAALRLTPEQLKKVTVPQAYELTDKINKYRAAEQEAAERAALMANLEAAPRLADEGFSLSFVDQPGGKWVDIPEVVDDKGMKLCTGIGNSGGWCTKEQGYAKKYGSGDSRLVALLDASGRPHVQVKIENAKVDSSRTELGGVLNEEDAAADQFYRNVGALLEQRGFDDGMDIAERIALGETRDTPQDVRDLLPEIYAEAERMLPTNELPKPDIGEIKPPGNSFDSDRATEYAKRDPKYQSKLTDSVLNFLNSGDWGALRERAQADLRQFGIVDLRGADSLINDLSRIYERPIREIAPAFNAAVDANPNAPRFMTTRQLREFIGPIEDAAPAPRAEPANRLDDLLAAEEEAAQWARQQARERAALRRDLEGPRRANEDDAAFNARQQRLRDEFPPDNGENDIPFARGGAVMRTEHTGYDAATIEALAAQLSEELNA